MAREAGSELSTPMFLIVNNLRGENRSKSINFSKTFFCLKTLLNTSLNDMLE